MAGNSLLTPSIIAKEAALQVVNNLVFARLANKQFKEDYAVKVGSTITYRKPIRFAANSGATLIVQDVTENSDTIVINKRYHVAWQFLSSDLTLTIDQYAERYLRPAAIQLAQQIDADGAAQVNNIYQAIGTAGTAPTFKTFLGGRGYLNQVAAPLNDRFAAIDPVATSSVLSGMTSFLNESLVEDITKEASIGRLVGTDLFESQNVLQHVKGTAATITVATTASEGDTALILTAGTPGTLVAGDIVTVATRYALNPLSKSTFNNTPDGGTTVSKQLQQWVVTATTTVSTATTVPVSPVIPTVGAYATVDSLPTASDVVTLVANHTQNCMFQRNAFSLVTVPIVAPEGAVWAETVEYQGLGMRFLRAYDVTNDVEIARLDVMYGWKTTYPELAVRILG